jgi:hypothetical protein
MTTDPQLASLAQGIDHAGRMLDAIADRASDPAVSAEARAAAVVDLGRVCEQLLKTFTNLNRVETPGKIAVS